MINKLRAARCAKLAANPPPIVPAALREKYSRMMRAKQAQYESGIEQPSNEPLDPQAPTLAVPVVATTPD